MTVVFRDRPDLGFRETESLIGRGGEDIVHLHVVQAGEHPGFGNLHHTRHICHLKRWIAFQRG